MRELTSFALGLDHEVGNPEQRDVSRSAHCAQHHKQRLYCHPDVALTNASVQGLRNSINGRRGVVGYELFHLLRIEKFLIGCCNKLKELGLYCSNNLFTVGFEKLQMKQRGNKQKMISEIDEVKFFCLFFCGLNSVISLVDDFGVFERNYPSVFCLSQLVSVFHLLLRFRKREIEL